MSGFFCKNGDQEGKTGLMCVGGELVPVGGGRVEEGKYIQMYVNGNMRT
jgi:hypothetical protein